MPKPDPRKTVVLPISKAKATLSELVERVKIAGERVVLTRHEKVVAVIVPASDVPDVVKEAA